MTNDQVLWFRNIIRAQAKDILQDMMVTKWEKIEDNKSFKLCITNIIKSETAGLTEKLENLAADCKKKQRRIN